MARSVNLASGLRRHAGGGRAGLVMTPRHLMARTHEAFDIDAHVPHAFGEW